MKKVLTFVFATFVALTAAGQDHYALAAGQGVFLTGNTESIRSGNKTSVTFNLSPNSSYELRTSGQVKFSVDGASLTGELSYIEINTEERPMVLTMWVSYDGRGRETYAYALVFKGRVE